MGHVDSAGSSSPVLFDEGGGAGVPVGSRLVMFDSDGKRAIFLGGLAIYVYDIGDAVAESSVIAMLSRADLASDVSIGQAFGCHRNTVGRLSRRLESGGMGAVVPARRGPKAPHKVTQEILDIVAAEHDRYSAAGLGRVVAARTGVMLSVSHVRRLVHALVPAPLALDEPAPSVETTFTPRAEGDGGAASSSSRDDDGVGVVSDVWEAPVARGAGSSGEPPVVVPGRVSGRYMGLSLYYPALNALGLVDAARSCFRVTVQGI